MKEVKEIKCWVGFKKGIKRKWLEKMWKEEIEEKGIVERRWEKDWEKEIGVWI